MIARWLAVLFILLYAGLGGFLFFTAGQRPASGPYQPGKPRPAPPPRFRIYYEKDPLPEAWARAWAAQQRVELAQVRLRQDANGEWPRDGDVYIVSPRWLQSLQSQVALSPLTDRAPLRAVNPAFTSQPFDADNAVSVPWRWTPYVFYLRHDKALPREKNRAVFYFRAWVNDARCLWPNDWDLLLALQIHYSGQSANHQFDNYAEQIAALQETCAAVTATEAACWQALLDGKIHCSFLPATYMEMGVADERRRDIEIQPPGLGNHMQSAGGTIVYLDQLVIGAGSLRADQARELIAWLLSPAQQERLIQDTGYFPVVSKVGHEFDFAPAPLPKDYWFNRSEFLVNRPPAPPAPAAAVSDQPPPPAPRRDKSESPPASDGSAGCAETR
ncbi:MAG: extracellular solute-binding protein [Verrucomicrobiales bacterium]|jgi:spermidine/putrescine-binding protein|nr:extracellular solute-binding protein [Verrucomicrobiales bacterium]